MSYLLPLALFVAVRLFASTAQLAMPVAAPATVQELGVDVSLVGLITGFTLFGTMIGSPMSGTLVARFGAVRVMQVGLATCAAVLVFATTGYVWAIPLAAFVLGLGQGPITPAGSDLLVRFVPPRMRSLTFGVTQAAVPMGSALAGAMVPVIAVAFGWRAGLLAVALLCVALALVVAPLRPRFDAARAAGTRLSMASTARSVREAIALVLRDRSLREVTLAACVFGALEWCTATFLIAYLGVGIGLAYVTAGWALAASQIAGTAGRVVLGPIADLVGSPRVVLAWCGLIMTASGVATAYFSAAWPIFAIVAVSSILGFAGIGWTGIYLSEIARLAPEGKAAAATGGSIFLFCLVGIFAPAAFSGLVGITGDYGHGFLVLSVGTGIITVRLVWPGRTRVEDW